jgi:deoxyribodipyrimidine photo-lyase
LCDVTCRTVRRNEVNLRDPAGVDARRVRELNRRAPAEGPVVYWMSRDQRVADNWALLHAMELASARGSTVAVVFCLVSSFLGATWRQYDFMLEGLKEVEKELEARNIPFLLLSGDPVEVIVPLVEDLGCGALVTDFDPLKVKREWRAKLAEALDIPVCEVDAHNIVPCRQASDKQEYAAYTIRPKISRLLAGFLVEFPEARPRRSASHPRFAGADWDGARRTLRLDGSVEPVSWIKPGAGQAVLALSEFIEHRLPLYATGSNDPNRGAQSDLSPYLHFGQLSAQRVALAVARSTAPEEARDSFLEQLIVRRELADNLCWYNADYDSVACFPDWAKKTLDEHRGDARPYRYDSEQLEAAQTHDDLWNAAQLEMVRTGKMHGYMRMYWAKKLLEWTRSPEEAMDIAIRLNDTYELDGRDPGGYAGIAWSIGGVHDRAFKERAVSGKIRYMSYAGCRRKFDVDAYINKSRK